MHTWFCVYRHAVTEELVQTSRQEVAGQSACHQITGSPTCKDLPRKAKHLKQISPET